MIVDEKSFSARIELYAMDVMSVFYLLGREENGILVSLSAIHQS